MEGVVLRGLSRYLISFDENTFFKFLFIFRQIYICSNTHPLTQSHAYPPSHKSHINTPFLMIGYQVKATPKSHANTLYDACDIVITLRKKIASGAGLRQLYFRVKVTVQNLFTTNSSKPCTEHVHNFSHTVPYTVWFVRKRKVLEERLDLKKEKTGKRKSQERK